MSVAGRPRAAQVRYIAALVVLTCVWLAMLVWGRGPLDRAVYQALYAGDRKWLAIGAHVVTTLGDPTVLVGAGAICAIWLWYRGHRHLPLVLIAITLIGRGLAEVQKYWVARPRPELEPHLVIVKTSSFPSGHATSSMIFYLTIALTLTARSRWHRIAAAAAILVSLMVGLSRVMLGVHWPSDVIGGWSFGLLWVLLTLRLSRRLLETDR